MTQPPSDLDPAQLKASFDSEDPNPMICRCKGAAEPLEPTGPHCARCRRMFSVKLRMWLTRPAADSRSRSGRFLRLRPSQGLRSTG